MWLWTVQAGVARLSSKLECARLRKARVICGTAVPGGGEFHAKQQDDESVLQEVPVISLVPLLHNNICPPHLAPNSDNGALGEALDSLCTRRENHSGKIPSSWCRALQTFLSGRHCLNWHGCSWSSCFRLSTLLPSTHHLRLDPLCASSSLRFIPLHQPAQTSSPVLDTRYLLCLRSKKALHRPVTILTSGHKDA